MFFAYMVLRHAAGPLDRPLRVALWRRVFDRFFPWVWTSIILLLRTSYAMLFHYLAGSREATGTLMMLLFVRLYFVPWRRFGRTSKGMLSPKRSRSLVRFAGSSPSSVVAKTGIQ
jgi:hypothetical protein